MLTWIRECFQRWMYFRQLRTDQRNLLRMGKQALPKWVPPNVRRKGE